MATLKRYDVILEKRAAQKNLENLWKKSDDVKLVRRVVVI